MIDYKIRSILLAGGFPVTILLGGCNVPLPPQTDQPNVIYVFPDQMRNHAMGFWRKAKFRDAVHFTGDPVHTPNLNQFADESIVLTSAMSNFPVSSPYRGCFFTGKFPANSGVSLNCRADRPVSSLPIDAECISDVFSKAGYNCAYIGKLHLDHPTPNDPENPGEYVGKARPTWDAYTPPERRHGFDYWYSYGTFDTHKHPHYWDTEGKRHDINEWSPKHEADKAIAYLRNEGNVRDKNKPFFMVVSFNPPHSPYHSLNDCMEEDYNLYKDKPLDSLLIRPNVNFNMHKNKCAPYYFASVTGIDREFGRILEELKKQGLDKNTIVVFTSDHGETMCSQGAQDAKNSPYAESMNVPFLIRYPQKLAPRIDQEMILSTPDIMPTLLGLSGLGNKIPTAVEGRNYADWFLEKSRRTPLRNAALYIRNVDGEKDADGNIISYYPIARGIKTTRYTLALTVNKDTKKLEKALLFDDLNDPYQMHNLSLEDNKEVVAMLCEKMVPLLVEANDPWYKENILKDMIPYN